MMRKMIIIKVCLIILLAGIITTMVSSKGRLVSLRGVVIQQDPDPRKQAPIADVEISAPNEMAFGDSKSDSTGFFRIMLVPGIKTGHPIDLRFEHPEYQPLDLKADFGNRLYVIRMTPLHREENDPNHPDIVIGNVLVRYTREVTTVSNVGSVVRTFEIVNTANLPCDPRSICSPDGKWKATKGYFSLDAGQGNEFRNARVSCIAGPCPFTAIDSDKFSKGGSNIAVSVRNWSDTATYLIQAEVFHHEVSDTVQESTPLILGRSLEFTLPPSAEGPSVQAELNGAAIIFPVGINTSLSWADCKVRTAKDTTKTYRCDLKPGYRFQ